MRTPVVSPYTAFNALPDSRPEDADVLLLPLPYERTVSSGRGTGLAPAAIWAASQQGEFYDDEMGRSLDEWTYYSAQPPVDAEPGVYHTRVTRAARALHEYDGLVVGVGGEHSVTPPLIEAAMDGAKDYRALTVVHFDAHADLRPQWGGSRYSHASALYPVVERGAALVTIGIGDISREELRYAQEARVALFRAQELATNDALLLARLARITGPVYVTVDVDCLDLSLCPGTGTPVPGGLSWNQAISYLKALLYGNRATELIGLDLVETVPQSTTQINETVAVGLLDKAILYALAAPLR